MKVSCKLVGGVGNVFFIIATTIAYALKHGIDYCLPSEIDNPHIPNQKVFYSPYLSYCNNGVDTTATVYNELHFHYTEIPAPTSKHILLNGYFQSYLFFHDYRDEIIKLFNIPYEFKESVVFIHYRLGDYKTLGRFHKIISDEYIQSALSYFSDLGYKNFLVFSDEISIAKEVINSEKYKELSFEYSEGKTELEDLSLMSSCQHGILSASSFSWWGAYLGRNDDRIILYPSEWFGESLAHHNTSDLCPPSWIKI